MENQTEELVVQEVSTTEILKGKQTFGIKSLNRPTPLWVTWVFRTEFILNKAALLFFASDINVFQLKILACFDFIVWGVGKFAGIKRPDEVG